MIMCCVQNVRNCMGGPENV